MQNGNVMWQVLQRTKGCDKKACPSRNDREDKEEHKLKGREKGAD